MTKLLALGLMLVLVSGASAATPLENAAAIAAQLGVSVPATPLKLATPPSTPLAPSAGGPVRAQSSGPLSGYIWLSGNGSVNCSGGPSGSGMMSGWVYFNTNVTVTTNDGAQGTVPLSGNVYLSGSCQNGAGWLSGSAFLNGSGTLYKDGKYVGSANLSTNAFINQYVNAPFVWINQNVYVSGSYSTTTAANSATLRADAVKKR